MADSKVTKFDYGYSEEFEIFQSPLKDTGVLQTKWIQHLPTASLNHGSSIEFYVRTVYFLSIILSFQNILTM